MYKIGILQLTQNLDDAVKGFKAGFAGCDVSAQFHYYNADGNSKLLPELAKKLKDISVDLVFACSTPAAQAAVNLDGKIPVVFTPVFDPIGAGLAKSFKKPGGKATGVAGMVAASDKVSFIRRLLPGACNIGLLYHVNDDNAQVETANFKAAAAAVFHLTEIPVHQPEDLSRLSEMLPAGLDALFLPIGRMIEENFATVAYYAEGLNLPVIASHAPNVPAGALGALTANHFQLGYTCAEKALTILKGVRPPGLVPIDIVQNPEIFLNAYTADLLNIVIPNDLLQEAKEIF